MSCGNGGRTHWIYSGNQVGYLNFVGLMNFVAGGPDGSGISAGKLVSQFIRPPISREPWNDSDAQLNQQLLDASFPFIQLNWIANIDIGNGVLFRVSDKNVYVEDSDGTPRFYEARADSGPTLLLTNGEWLAPSFEIGDLSLKLNNRDGFFNKYLAQGDEYNQWMGGRIDVLVGFGEKISNYFNVFTGFIASKKGITVTDKDISIRAYDLFENDEVPIPATVFDNISYPDIQEGASGKSVPLVYGDWSEEVGDFGEIPGFCTNAFADIPANFIFQISQNQLFEIGDVYLHRGDRVAGSIEGPILLDDTQFTKSPEFGQIVIPANAPALTDFAVVIDNSQAGSGSGLNEITSNTAELNFIIKGVKANDKVFKTKTSEVAVVFSVASNQLILTGGITFDENDEYSIRTKNYSYFKGDKLSVFCKGKNVRNISLNRLSDAGLGASVPRGLTVGLDGTYWFCDNDSQKIYQVTFKNELVKQINYLDISPEITSISGFSIQTDNTLWIFDDLQSKIYRWLIDDQALGLSFSTVDIFGLGTALTSGSGLTVDTGNLIYIVDNFSGEFYVINPFANPAPTLVYQWNRSAFEASAVDIYDLSVDVNLQEVLVADRNNQKYYRIDATNGSFITEYAFSLIADNATFIVGISAAQDGTVFLLNRENNTLYNFNEEPDASNNAGFICRDLVQAYTGKVSSDFDLNFNQTSREDLSKYKCRVYIDSKTNVITAVNKILQQYNTVLYIKFTRYALFHITFDNFREDGGLINEGDIQENSFKANKEYGQYFNSAFGDYADLPFSQGKTRSDTYVSPKGIEFAGKEISKRIDMPNVYLRNDVDKLMPLFVRLAAPEPEFLTFTTSWRFIFTQLTQFFRMNFYEMPDCETGLKKGGRRFEKIPCFIRELSFDLTSFTIQVKAWSLGTTQFGTFIPNGPFAGGESDKIVLTNLGTVGYIAPVGYITAATVNSITIADVGGDNAENRTAPVVGKAWLPGYRVAIIDAITQAAVEHPTISSVVGQVITFTENLAAPVVPSVLNSAGFVVGGYYVKYANYEFTSADQKDDYAYFGRPEVGYPTSGSQEVEEQRAGLHSFEDDRQPYVLFPAGFVP